MITHTICIMNLIMACISIPLYAMRPFTAPRRLSGTSSIVVMILVIVVRGLTIRVYRASIDVVAGVIIRILVYVVTAIIGIIIDVITAIIANLVISVVKIFINVVAAIMVNVINVVIITIARILIDMVVDLRTLTIIVHRDISLTIGMWLVVRSNTTIIF